MSYQVQFQQREASYVRVIFGFNPSGDKRFMGISLPSGTRAFFFPCLRVPIKLAGGKDRYRTDNSDFVNMEHLNVHFPSYSAILLKEHPLDKETYDKVRSRMVDAEMEDYDSPTEWLAAFLGCVDVSLKAYAESMIKYGKTVKPESVLPISSVIQTASSTSGESSTVYFENTELWRK
ncbi:hypothetical protein DFH11DRAFT_1637670 [Phellopilus nigrolimitatus]|nr:hypothetical protein DFH11DRAFT_1637670 [Phellopilus nigrolimitatus]